MTLVRGGGDLPVNESILVSIKKLLGLGEDYEAYDTDIIIHINSVLGILTQLGVGPKSGFSISDESAVWSDFIGERSDLNTVKTYIALKVRLLFDPPTIGSVMEAAKETIKELEWRLNVQAET